ncbi:hypothetical protein CHS0354_030958, partial [Potamilus streckersoni]
MGKVCMFNVVPRHRRRSQPVPINLNRYILEDIDPFCPIRERTPRVLSTPIKWGSGFNETK